MGLGRDLFYAAGALATSPIWATNLIQTGKWRSDWAGKLGRVSPPLPSKQTGRKRLLIHGVSVGEVNLIRNLISELQTDDNLEIVIATTTNTGYARAASLYGDRHAVVRYPLDFSLAVSRFLDAVQPDAVALVELEVWPNFMDACMKRTIPVAVINGRLTERSFKGYRKIRPLIRSAFSQLAVAAVQNADYAKRFEALGVPAKRVRVLDTMKWDTANITDQVEGAEQLARDMGIDRDRPLVVAGSTAPGEDELLIRTLPEDVQLLIAPRKPEWFDEVMKFAPDAVRRTEHSGSGLVRRGSGRVFLLDTIGELKMAYSLADICVVGRSFTGELYGSDMMEPIALGKPTIVGPYTRDFADTMKALLDAGGIIETDQPGDAVRELLKNKSMASELAEAGRAVIRSRQGSTARHAAMLRELLDI
jgi:3-deoxy-D-manno-octulosonic-acid transferase